MPKYTTAQNELLIDYSGRKQQNLKIKADWQKKAFGWSIFRLIFFFTAAALVILAATRSVWLCIIVTFVALIIFSWLIRRHIYMQSLATYHGDLAEVNSVEIDLLNYNFQGRSNGKQFFELDHLYSQDLDLFGEYSFFQFANRAATSMGQRAFAKLLSEVSKVAEILARQDAAQELSTKLEWRQRMQALGLQVKDDDRNFSLLQRWLASENFLSSLWYVPILLIAAPIWFLVSTTVCLTIISPLFLFVAWGLPIFVLSRFVTKINEVHRQTEKAGAILKQYADLIEHIELGDFSSELLNRLQKDFNSSTVSSSRAVRQLGFIIHQLDARNNAFAIVLNVIGLWDLYWVNRLEKWKIKYQNELAVWFARMADFEALLTLGTLTYNNPHWQFPELTSANSDLVAKGLAHPLIAPTQVIDNDLTMPSHSHLKLLTGSNMAGKSTFLRTLGLNVVLAMAGAPVCAKELSLPRLQVMTSMRTQDALYESTSSFYAELKRLKIIIESVENLRKDEELPQAFFLLDEILKGTNSRDRHAGSRALIEQLIKEKGAGVIATHDLELGVLEATSNGAVENLCIEVDVQNGELHFDYKLKKGLSKSFNATQLMKNMGIKIET